MQLSLKCLFITCLMYAADSEEFTEATSSEPSRKSSVSKQKDDIISASAIEFSASQAKDEGLTMGTELSDDETFSATAPLEVVAATDLWEVVAATDLWEVVAATDASGTDLNVERLAVADGSKKGTGFTFKHCDCVTTYSLPGESRWLIQECTIGGQGGDVPDTLKLQMWQNPPEFVFELTGNHLPNDTWIHAPADEFLVTTFSNKFSTENVPIGRHVMLWQVQMMVSQTIGSCYVEHIQLDPETEPSYKQDLYVASDFMGSLLGPQEEEKDEFAMMERFLDHHHSKDTEEFDLPLFFSAGNFVGGAVWQSLITGNVDLMRIFHALRVPGMNVGDLELTMGRDVLEGAVNLTWTGWTDWLSANIYHAGTDELAFKPLVERVADLGQWTGALPSRIRAYGVMTQHSANLVDGETMKMYDVRPDFHQRLVDDCAQRKDEVIGVLCVLLVAGGFHPDLVPDEEIAENRTEFAQIVNLMPNFDIVVGSSTMVEAVVSLSGKRIVAQPSPRGQNAVRVSWDRPRLAPRYPFFEAAAHPLPAEVADGGIGYWWSVQAKPSIALAKTHYPEVELGVFEGPVPWAADPYNMVTFYREESAIANLIASVIREHSSADIVMIEGSIAARGLIPKTSDETQSVYTSRHLMELLFRNKTETRALLATGEQIYGILAEQWDSDGLNYRPLGLSGIAVAYDRRQPPGKYVTDVRIGDRIVANSSNVTYKILTTDYLRLGSLHHHVIQSLPSDDTADEAPVLDTFKAHVLEHPLKAVPSQLTNGTVVLPRDADIYISFPTDPPKVAETPFAVEIHMTSKSPVGVLQGPFVIYRRDTGENLGRVEAVHPDKTSILQFETFLDTVTQLITLYAVHADWISHAYQRELAFALSLPALLVGDSDSDSDSASVTTQDVLPSHSQTHYLLGAGCLLFSTLLPLSI